MSSRCLWHACRALAAGLLLMLLGAAMATIGYYADQLSVAQEVRGNSTVAVKNEARGFHLNNLSYAGPIVMGVGGFIVVAACVMTFEARDSAAKVTPARPQTTPRRPTQAPWDQLGLFRGAAPVPRSSVKRWRGAGGSAPELCAARAAARPLRPQPHHALSFEEAPHFEHRHESQTSLALELHACGGVLLRVRDRSAAARRRVLARQHPLPDNEPVPSVRGSPVHSISTGKRRSSNGSAGLSVGLRTPRACSAPPRSPPQSESTPRRDSQ